MPPLAYIVAGPNGAGKTTFAREFLPRYAQCNNFINADLIAEGMAPFNPEAAAFRAGRLMLQEMDLFAKRKVDFGFESTLSGASHQRFIRRLLGLQYEVHIFFLWVEDVGVALSRIRSRVETGGHGVPEIVVRRRFHRSLRNFFRVYTALATSWILFDNSHAMPEVIASKEQGELRIVQPALYESLRGTL
jgi:predicted ABC-type ATPase